MPVIAPIMKVENCKKYGATVVSFGQNLGESREKALEISKEKDFLYINGYVIAEIPKNFEYLNHFQKIFLGMTIQTLLLVKELWDLKLWSKYQT
jgi:hypothetical protein